MVKFEFENTQFSSISNLSSTSTLSRSYNKDVNLFYYFIPTELYVYSMLQKNINTPSQKRKFFLGPPPPLPHTHIPFFHFLDEKKGALPTQPPM